MPYLKKYCSGSRYEICHEDEMDLGQDDVNPKKKPDPNPTLEITPESDLMSTS